MNRIIIIINNLSDYEMTLILNMINTVYEEHYI